MRSALLMAVLLGTLLGCRTTSTTVGSTFATTAPATVPPTPATVPVTLYFRSDASGASLLTPVDREVPRTGDPVVRALQLLIRGPEAGEALPVIPDGVRVSSLSVIDGTAHVRLEGDLDRGATRAAATGPMATLLPLAAIADTLTEFPSITAVDLEAVGTDGERAFGGWGIPDVLVRDETFIEPGAAGDPRSTTVALTGDGVQRLGGPQGSRVDVAGVRLIDRLGYARIAVALAEEVDPGQLPPASATVEGGEVVLRVEGVHAPADLPARLDGLREPFGDARVTTSADGELTIALSVTSGVDPQFHLFTETNPSRVLLDVKK